MDRRENPIVQAIRYSVEAGKLRAYVRKNGEGLEGFLRLADRNSNFSSHCLTEWVAARRGGADA